MFGIHVYSWGNIGDAVLFTPALRALRKANPEARIILYFEKVTHAEVFAGNPHIDSLKRLTRLRRVFHRLTASKIRVAPLGNVRPGILYNKHASIIMGEMIGVHVEDTTPEIYLNCGEVSQGLQDISRLRRPCVAIHPFSTFDSKNWAPARWEQVVRLRPEWSFVQIGGATDPKIAGVNDLCGTSLRRAFAIVRACDALVGVDSVMAHAATAFGVPSAVLFGASSPRVYGHHVNANLRAEGICDPCLELLFYEPCPFNKKCLAAIDPLAVEQILSKLLGKDGTTSSQNS